jgi:hypothetical protein
MRVSRSVTRSVAAAVAVGGTILAAAPAATAEVATPEGAQVAGPAAFDGAAARNIPGTIELHVREELVSLSVVDGVGSYEYVIRDQAGNAVGRTVGFCKLLSLRQSDNHEIAWCDDTMTFAAGALRTFGVIDQTTAFQGVPLTLHVVGTSGIYRDSVGIRRWQALAPGLALATSDIVLWGGGQDRTDGAPAVAAG